ncbi:MAG: hypothetical protein ACFFDW_10775 [Candidatus Thorarchaeota archaeon]
MILINSLHFNILQDIQSKDDSNFIVQQTNEIMYDLNFKELIFYNNIGFAIGYDSYLYTLDFSNPPYPVVIGSLKLVNNVVGDMKYWNGFLYLPCRSFGFKIIDVRSLTYPVLAYTFSPSYSYSVNVLEIINGYLIVPISFLFAIRIYDITDNYNPIVISEIEVIGLEEGYGDIIYSSNRIQLTAADEIAIVEYESVSSIGEPIRISYSLLNHLITLYSLGEYRDYTLVTSSAMNNSDITFKSSFLRYDPSEEPHPNLFAITTLIDGDFRKSVYLGSNIFVADYYNGLRIFKIINSNEIQQLSTYFIQSAVNLEFYENYIYLMTSYNNTLILDVKNTSKPMLYLPINYHTGNHTLIIGVHHFLLVMINFIIMIIRKKRKNNHLIIFS